MSRLPARIGFWAAAAESPISVIYIVGLPVLVATAPSQSSAAELAAQRWTDLTSHPQHPTSDPLSLAMGVVVRVVAFLAGLLILVVFLVLHELADPERRIVSRIAPAFALMMAVTSSLNYYLQLGLVRQVIMRGGELEGLGLFAELKCLLAGDGDAAARLGAVLRGRDAGDHAFVWQHARRAMDQGCLRRLWSDRHRGIAYACGATAPGGAGARCHVVHLPAAGLAFLSSGASREVRTRAAAARRTGSFRQAASVRPGRKRSRVELVLILCAARYPLGQGGVYG